MNESKTRDARRDRRTEEFDGRDVAREGKETDDIDIGIEAAGNWRRRSIMYVVDETYNSQRERLVVVVVKRNRSTR